MAATQNAIALSPRSTARDSTGISLDSAAFMAERQRLGLSKPSDSLVTAEAPPLDLVPDQTAVDAMAGSPTLPHGTGNGIKKPAWVKPNNAAVDSALVMGAVSWPTLSESTKASPKPQSIDFSTNPADLSISLPQVTPVHAPALLSPPPSDTQKLTTINPNNPNPNATQHHARPSRQRPIKREGGGNPSSNAGFSPQSPVHAPNSNNTSLGTTSGVSDPGHVNVSRDSNYRTGGDHSQQRTYRRNNSGSFSGRRDQDRGNHEWNHQRSFNGRDPAVPPQRGVPRGFIGPPLRAAPAYIPPPPLRPYVPPEMHPMYCMPLQPAIPYFGQLPPPLFYPPMDPQLYSRIVSQIDYYFSTENLVKDIYLRQNMDEHGWVPVQLIANFNKVLHMTTDIRLILHAMQGSSIVEVQGDKIRKRNDWMKWIMPSSVQFPTGTGSQSLRTPQGILGAHVQENAKDNSSVKVSVDAGLLPSSSSEDIDGLSEASKDGNVSTGC